MDSGFEIFIIKKYFSLLHQGHPEVKFVLFFFLTVSVVMKNMMATNKQTLVPHP